MNCENRLGVFMASRPVGRPSGFNQSIADDICNQVLEGQPIRLICSVVNMPSVATVMRWLHEYPAFAKQYAQAKEMYAHCIFDEILHIADTCNPLEVQKAKLMIDARKLVAAKLAPKKYGDKIEDEQDIEHREITINVKRVTKDIGDLIDELSSNDSYLN